MADMEPRDDDDEGDDAVTSFVPQTASPLSCVANMANSAMGAGVLAFPQAFYNSGIVTGLVISFAMVRSFLPVGERDESQVAIGVHTALAHT